MIALTAFRSRAEIEAERNLAAFIRNARATFSQLPDWVGLRWDAPVWPGVRWVKISVGKRRRIRSDDRLDPRFVDFAKAYSVWKSTHRPSALHWEHQALRCIESALITKTGAASIGRLSIGALDEAASAARSRFTPQARYHVGREISLLAQFVSARRLVACDLSMWKSPFARPSSVRRTGRAGRDEISSRLPSTTALYAMAEIFANDSEDAPTRFASAVWALLMCAPSRICEVLRLHVDAEYEEIDDAGAVSYGIRYYGAKGFAHDIKWVPKTMEPVAREAFRRLREMTESARALAKHLETTPDVPFRYPDAPQAGVDQPLTIEQKAAVLRSPVPASRGLNPKWTWRSIAEHWARVRATLPRGFPVFDPQTGLKWSEALFCVHRHLLHATRPVDWYGLAAPTAGTVNAMLGAARGKKGMFAKLGYTESDGSPLRLTTHQARHYLSTAAERGAMAQEDLAKWAGRALTRDNRVYNHIPESERTERIRDVLSDTTLAGPATALPAPRPVTASEYDWGSRGPTHRTEFGICEHDWAASPCMKHRGCLNCSEHVCVKGDVTARARIKAKHDHHLAECTKALDAVLGGAVVADRWLEHALKSLLREHQLLALMDSDAIEDGAAIRLADARAEHTHLGRALDQRLPQLRDPSLPESIRNLISRYSRGESPLDAAD